MKIGIVGMGWVGSGVAISTLHSGLAQELLVNDKKQDLAVGEAMDLAHGASFCPAARVQAASVEEMLTADAIVLAAGRGGNPEETRLDLLTENATIARSVGRTLRGFQGIVVVVSNPVDIMTHLVAESSGLPFSRVIGTGTMLDTARLRHALGDLLELDPRSIHANVVGEHGDSEVILWSGVRFGGTSLRNWPGWSGRKEADFAETTRGAAQEIIRRKGATNHAIGLATTTLLKSALGHEQRVLTVSRVQEGACGVDQVALSLPTVVGADGAQRIIEPEMSTDEHIALLRSADVLRRAFASVRAK